MAFSMAEFNRLKSSTEKFKRASANARAKLGEVTQDLVRAAEVSGTALLLGYVQGKREADGKGSFKPFGIPLDLGVGFGCHVLGIMGVGGAEEHFKAIGDAGLATYFSTMGYSAGKSGKGLIESATQGALGPKTTTTSGASLTADDLAKLATE